MLDSDSRMQLRPDNSYRDEPIVTYSNRSKGSSSKNTSPMKGAHKKSVSSIGQSIRKNSFTASPAKMQQKMVEYNSQV